MSQEAEKVKKLITFKKKLKERVADLEREREELRILLEAVDFMLLEKGFKRAEIVEAPAVAAEILPQEEASTGIPQSEIEYENIIPLKTDAGEPLANIYVNHDSLRVVLTEGKEFNVNTPPFRQFLVERVLTRMQEKDNELARTGELAVDRVFYFNILQEGDLVRELEIRNSNNSRLRELKSSIRWTLEKMYEKAQSKI